ncbi:hypothetical protein D3C72_2018960 [compost metagenome]
MTQRWIREEALCRQTDLRSFVRVDIELRFWLQQLSQTFKQSPFKVLVVTFSKELFKMTCANNQSQKVWSVAAEKLFQTIEQEEVRN